VTGASNLDRSGFPTLVKETRSAKINTNIKKWTGPTLIYLKPDIRPGRTPSTQFWLLTVLSLNART